MLSTRTSLFTILMCLGTFVYAQDTLREPVTFSIYANLGFPSSQLKSAVNNSTNGTAIGIGTNVLVNLSGKKRAPSPFALGMDVEYFYFGRDKIEATASAPPYKTSYNFWNVSGVARLILSKRPTGFVPFVDGMLGVKTFSVRTKIDKDLGDYILGDDEEDIIGIKNYTGLGYGVGLGWFTRKPKDNGGGASFSVRLMYLGGDDIKYIKRGTLQVDSDGNLTFETGTTNTNMILVQLGVTLH